MKEQTINKIVQFVGDHYLCSSKDIYDGIKTELSYATIKRILTKLVSDSILETTGQGKGRKYLQSPAYQILSRVNVDKYFEKEIDERGIKESYNFSLISNVMSKVFLFTYDENQLLKKFQNKFQEKSSQLTKTEYLKELERLAIDLSWKSSQIEGNTYSLLETERLLKEKETAEGKSQSEAVMLLNHKEALDFIISNPDYVSPVSISTIENIHSILIKDLGVDRNIRKRSVGITGTNYKPLDNEYQIKEALDEMCELINNKNDILEKAFLALILLSYIQPFSDGNKRTARIISNAILINDNYCPISFRTVDSVEFKKAMLIFYEQNNISAIKRIFIDQFKFAVETYF